MLLQKNSVHAKEHNAAVLDIHNGTVHGPARRSKAAIVSSSAFCPRSHSARLKEGGSKKKKKNQSDLRFSTLLESQTATWTEGTLPQILRGFFQSVLEHSNAVLALQPSSQRWANHKSVPQPGAPNNPPRTSASSRLTQSLPQASRRLRRRTGGNPQT